MPKKYLVEQYEEDEEPKKAKEAINGGIEDKEKNSQLSQKAEEPSTQSGQSMVIPDVPLEQVKVLTEQVTDSSNILNELVSIVKDLSAKVDGLIAQNQTEESPVQESIGEEEPEALTEEAIGFEGDNPSGPSLGSKSDIDGGIKKDEVSQTSTVKADNPSTQSGQDMVIPDDDLENVKQLNERLSGRRVLTGTYTGKTKFTESSDIVSVMKEYAKGVKA